MSRTLKLILAINLVVLAILALAYPHLMIAPGKLIAGHGKLETDCFACHTPWLGASTERCVACHKPEQIGKVTTLGSAIQKPLTSAPFHQKLVKQDCLACHSDHAGVKRYRLEGRFNHTLLQADARNACQSCHKKPDDTLHQQITGNCSQCHTQQKWTPATFEHDRFFVLDRDHNAACATCHVRNDYRSYTCYGCHEHSPEKIRREHIKEGVREFKNCVECHRSANEHDIKRSGQDRNGGNSGQEKNDD